MGSYKVYKFGGASIADAECLRNSAAILSKYKDEKLLIVVSAAGKTTNALEQVVQSYWEGNSETEKLLSIIRSAHEKIAADLFDAGHPVFDSLNDLIVQINWVIEEQVKDEYDYIYDQIVSAGEFLSSAIFCGFLKEQGFKAEFLDVRDCIRTNDTYREGEIDWEITSKQIEKRVLPMFERANFIVTQGFIGSTKHNQTTTLGREGSDFTASIFSHALDAECMVIWKDVPGILTADPDLFANVTKIDRLSYKEAIEMTYYGAKVIHPKTIKPIQNKNIPLYVKSFLEPEGEGTLISEEMILNYPPVVVLEHNQVLLHISTRDFSFVAESHLSDLFDRFNKHRIKVNMMRNTAISFSVCTHQLPERLDPLLEELEGLYKVIQDRDLELITIRHFNELIVNEMKQNKIVLFEERLRDTIQMVVSTAPPMKRK